MVAMAHTEFHSRVTLSIGAMLRTPSPRPATGAARVPSRVSSAVGTLRVPSLSLRRLTRMPLYAPTASRVSR